MVINSIIIIFLIALLYWYIKNCQKHQEQSNKIVKETKDEIEANLIPFLIFFFNLNDVDYKSHEIEEIKIDGIKVFKISFQLNGCISICHYYIDGFIDFDEKTKTLFPCILECQTN